MMTISMNDFFHKRDFVATLAVIRIQDAEKSAVGQRLGVNTTRPAAMPNPEEVVAKICSQILQSGVTIDHRQSYL